MPIYEYRCPKCGHEFDKIMKFGADAPPCPECQNAETNKMVSQTSFHLKGSGWYVTDYKDKPAGASANAVGDAPSAPSESTESSGGDASDGGGSDGGSSSGGASDSGTESSPASTSTSDSGGGSSDSGGTSSSSSGGSSDVA